MGSSYLSIRAREGIFPGWITLLGSIFIGVGWMLSVKFTKVPLVSVSAIADVCACVGFYFGLLILGEEIKPIQYLGICFLGIGLYLINR